jgi:hypothetical protein
MVRSFGSRSRWIHPSLILLLCCSSACTAIPARSADVQLLQAAPSPQNPQKALLSFLEQVDAAANSKDIQALMPFYSLEFTNSDGLNRQTLEKSIRLLWKEYPNLTYRTELLDVLPSRGPGIEIETITYATSKSQIQGRQVELSLMVKSRQRWEDEKLVQQTILTEQNRMSLGDRPPTVSIKLPDSVKVGQKYTYEAVLQEPLAPEDYVMGNILTESITPSSYLSGPKIQVEMPSIAEILSDRGIEGPIAAPNGTTRRVRLKKLRTGGFFKTAQAPAKPEDQWLSAILVRPSGGLTLISQRLQIVN